MRDELRAKALATLWPPSSPMGDSVFEGKKGIEMCKEPGAGGERQKKMKIYRAKSCERQKRRESITEATNGQGQRTRISQELFD